MLRILIQDPWWKTPGLARFNIQTQSTSNSFSIFFSALLCTAKEKEGKPDRKPHPPFLWFKKSIQKTQVWRTLRITPRKKPQKLYVHEFGFCPPIEFMTNSHNQRPFPLPNPAYIIVSWKRKNWIFLFLFQTNRSETGFVGTVPGACHRPPLFASRSPRCRRCRGCSSTPSPGPCQEIYYN